jgi:hypothetical protein
MSTDETRKRPTSGSSSSGAARARVGLHMQRLLATAATTAAIATGCGFGVVDPVPPPARCPNLAEQIVITGTYVMGANGLEIHVTFSPPANRSDVTFAAPTSIGSGTLVSATPGATLTLVLLPTAGATSITFAMDVSCSQSGKVPDAMLVSLTVAPGAMAGDAVTGAIGELNE